MLPPHRKQAATDSNSRGGAIVILRGGTKVFEPVPLVSDLRA